MLALSALLMLPAITPDPPPAPPDWQNQNANLGAWYIQMGGCYFSGNTKGGSGSALERLPASS